MKCPKCHGELHEMRIEGVDLDFCDSCKGMWFDQDEMAFMAELPEDIPDRSVQQNAHATTHPCPRCQDVMLEEMKFVNANELLIDRCPQCKGIFLDKGELPKVERIGARIGDARSKLLLTSKKLQEKGYQVLGIQS